MDVEAVGPLMDVVGVVLAGGRGERARPLTTKAPGYLRSKAAVSFCGKRLIRWLLESLRLQGIRQFLVVARGKENRYQTKMLVGFGEELGVKVRYSPVRFDPFNTGSADATLRELDHWGIDGPALVVPCDSLYDFSLSEMLEAHAVRGALVSVGAMAVNPLQVAGKYGVMLHGHEGRVAEFVEKPSLDQLHRLSGTGLEELHHLPLWANAGMYLIESLGLRKFGEDPEIVGLREHRLDFGKDLLPWLVHNDFPVYAHPLRAGDLGTVVDYIDTLGAMLRGEFPSLTPLLGKPFDADRNIWIPPETLQHVDQVSGKTLEEKLEEGLVEIGSNVRLGRYVELSPGVRIEGSNVDDGVEIGEGAEIRGCAVGDGTIIGPHARIVASYLGTMVQVRSERRHPTVMEGYAAAGDEVVIGSGARLTGPIALCPRVEVPSGLSRSRIQAPGEQPREVQGAHLAAYYCG